MPKLKKGPPQKGPTKGSKVWTAEGAEHIYRAPYHDAKRKTWRVRRRNRFTNAVDSLTLLSSSEGEARREVQELAFGERSAAEEEKKNPEIVRPEKITVEDALLGRKVVQDGRETRHGGWVHSFDVRPSTLSGYCHESSLFSELLGRERLLSSIAYGDLEQLFTVTWKDLSGRSKIYRRGLLSRFFDWSVAHGFARANWVKKIPLQKSWRKEAVRAAQTTGQALTIEEARRLLAECKKPVLIDYRPDTRAKGEEVKKTELAPQPHLWWFVFITLRSGLRISNVLGSLHNKPGLLWRHVDLDQGILTIPAELMKGDAEFCVPIHEELWGELQKLVRTLDRVPAPDERVVPGDAVETKKSFQSALKRAGLGDRGFRPHDLRHSFVSWLSEFCPYAPLGQLAGHSKSRTVTDRYAHPKIEVLRGWLNKLPSLFSEPTTGRGRKGTQIDTRDERGDKASS